MRIAKALALAGVDSRRKCEAHVLAGKVSVNGQTVLDLGRQVDPDHDAVIFDGKRVLFEKPVYFLLNKPVGYTTTADDPHAEKTVYDLLPPKLVPAGSHARTDRTRVFPVGRLDKDSTGLLLFTNDGELANRLTHPRYEVAKWYEAELDRTLEAPDRERLLRGVRLEEGPARAERVQTLSSKLVRVMIREGKKREIRRMFEAVGYRVTALCRIAFGPLEIGNLQAGRGRFLTTREVEQLRQSGSDFVSD